MSEATMLTPPLGSAGGRRRFLQNLGLAATGLAATGAILGTDLAGPALAESSDWNEPHRTGRRTTRIQQVVVYHGATPQQLFDLYTNSSSHSAATHPASGDVRWVDPVTGDEHEAAAVGLVMEGFPLPNGSPGLTAEVIGLVPGKRIVQSWINFAWQLPTKARPSSRPSMLTLDFRANTVGAEIRLKQARLPTYDIDLTPSPFTPNGEQGPLSEIVRVHWELLYWQPIRRYLLDQAADEG
jgi:hypothetical protein